MAMIVLMLTWLVALAGLCAWPYLARSSTIGDDLTRHTVWLALAYYVAAGWIMLALRPTAWRTATARGRLVRLCWTLAWAAFVIHVGVAFHFYHHWSHTAAVMHVRERSGVGEGIFASYLFTLAWTADVAWWWMSPTSYSTRSAWIDRVLHGFMFFMIFMATVVYESGAIRWVGLVLSAALAVRFATLRRNAPRPTPPSL
jgi:hypothetical protein